MSVTNEVGKLTMAGLFGPPGIESYLAQFYDSKVSLFFEEFDIFKGRKEFDGLITLLESFNVEVINLKKIYAQTLPSSILSAEMLIKKLKQKVPLAKESVLEKLLQIDAKAYGEEKAVILNENLSLIPKYPLGNIFFAKDQSSIIFNACILSNMKYDIRKAEVNVFYRALKSLGYQEFLQINDNSLEGGDIMIIDGDIYIGCGMRTDLNSVKQIANYYKPQGITTYAVTIPVSDVFKSDMNMMHLDTFFMPLSLNKAIGCFDILKRCKIVNVKNNNESPFLEHFMRKGYDVFNIPKEEQENYAANLLVVDSGKVIVPSNYNYLTTQTLINNGIAIYSANLSELTKAVGATHCMTLQLKKS